MPVIREDRNQRFDADGNLVSEERVKVDVTEDVVLWDLHVQLRAALAANQEFLSNPTHAAVLDQVEALTRQVSALIKLTFGEFGEGDS